MRPLHDLFVVFSKIKHISRYAPLATTVTPLILSAPMNGEEEVPGWEEPENWVECLSHKPEPQSRRALEMRCNPIIFAAFKLINDATSFMPNPEERTQRIGQLWEKLQSALETSKKNKESYEEGKLQNTQFTQEFKNSATTQKVDFSQITRKNRSSRLSSREKPQEKTEFPPKDNTTWAQSFEVFAKDRVGRSIAIGQLASLPDKLIEAFGEFISKQSSSSPKKTLSEEFMSRCLSDPENNENTCRTTLHVAKKVVSKTKEMIEDLSQPSKSSLSEEFMSRCLLDPEQNEPSCQSTLDFGKLLFSKTGEFLSTPSNALPNRLIELGFSKEQAFDHGKNVESLILASLPLGMFGGTVKKAGSMGIKGLTQSESTLSKGITLSIKEKKKNASASHAIDCRREVELVKEIQRETPTLKPSEQLANFFGSPLKKEYEEFQYRFSSKRPGADQRGTLKATIQAKPLDNNNIVYRIRYKDGSKDLVNSIGLYSPEKSDILLHALFEHSQTKKFQNILLAYEPEAPSLLLRLPNHSVPITKSAPSSLEKGPNRSS